MASTFESAAAMNTEKQELPGDQYAKKYIKTPKSLYCYASDIVNLDLFQALQKMEEGKEVEVGEFFWTKKNSILFRKTKEEQKTWNEGGKSFKKGTWDNRKVTEFQVVAMNIGEAAGLLSVNDKLKKGFEFFGKDWASSVILYEDKFIVGMVKKE